MAQQPTVAFIPLKSSPWPGDEHEEADMETGKSVAQKLVPFTLATVLMIFLLMDEKIPNPQSSLPSLSPTRPHGGWGAETSVGLNCTSWGCHGV